MMLVIRAPKIFFVLVGETARLVSILFFGAVVAVFFLSGEANGAAGLCPDIAPARRQA